MSSAAWKALELRIARDLGAGRRPSVGPEGWARGSDDDGTARLSLQTKRTARYQLRSSWVEQARRDAKRDGRPWLLVVAEHGARRPIAIMDYRELLEILRAAGLAPPAE